MDKIVYMKNKKIDLQKLNVRQMILTVIGTFLMGVAYKSIYDTSGMVTGGFTGIAIIVKRCTLGIVDGGIPLWCTNAILNIPVFIVAYIVKGKSFVKRTFVATVSLTIFLAILPTFEINNTDLLLTAVFGGTICGCGIAMVLLASATTGGSDLIAAIIQNYNKHYSIARIMQFIDGIIVVAGVFIFGMRTSLYAVIAIYVTTIVSDRVMDGLKFAKVIYIISDKYKNISEIIMKELERGVTTLNGNGMYSNTEKHVIFCVVSKKQSVIVKEIVMLEDPSAFVIVSDVREVMGEGFVKNIQ